MLMAPRVNYRSSGKNRTKLGKNRTSLVPAPAAHRGPLRKITQHCLIYATLSKNRHPAKWTAHHNGAYHIVQSAVQASKHRASCAVQGSTVLAGVTTSRRGWGSVALCYPSGPRHTPEKKSTKENNALSSTFGTAWGIVYCGARKPHSRTCRPRKP